MPFYYAYIVLDIVANIMFLCKSLETGSFGNFIASTCFKHEVWACSLQKGYSMFGIYLGKNYVKSERESHKWFLFSFAGLVLEDLDLTFLKQSHH